MRPAIVSLVCCGRHYPDKLYIVAARIASMGPLNEKMRAIVVPQFAQGADIFVKQASTIMWCHSASLALLTTLPVSLPSIDGAALQLYKEIELSAAKATSLEASEEMYSDIRRFWQLSQLLVSQKDVLSSLERLLRVDWRTWWDLEATSPTDQSNVRLLDEKEKLGPAQTVSYELASYA